MALERDVVHQHLPAGVDGFAGFRANYPLNDEKYDGGPE